MSEEKTTTQEKINPIIAGIQAAEILGTAIAKSNMFGCKTLEQGQLIALACITKKIDPFQFKATYHVFDDGTICMRADAMLAKFKTNGGTYSFVKHNEQVCTMKFTWAGITTESTFTIEQARKKGLIKAKSAWEKWPEDLLFSTVVRKYLRRYVPELFAGHYLPEEHYEDVTENSIPIIESKPLLQPKLPPKVQVTPEANGDDKPLTEILTENGFDMEDAYAILKELNYIREDYEDHEKAINSMNESMTNTVKNNLDKLKDKIEKSKKESE